MKQMKKSIREILGRAQIGPTGDEEFTGGGVPGLPDELTGGGVPGLPDEFTGGGVPGIPDELTGGGVPGDRAHRRRRPRRQSSPAEASPDSPAKSSPAEASPDSPATSSLAEASPAKSSPAEASPATELTGGGVPGLPGEELTGGGVPGEEFTGGGVPGLPDEELTGGGVPGVETGTAWSADPRNGEGSIESHGPAATGTYSEATSSTSSEPGGWKSADSEGPADRPDAFDDPADGGVDTDSSATDSSSGGWSGSDTMVDRQSSDGSWSVTRHERYENLDDGTTLTVDTYEDDTGQSYQHVKQTNPDGSVEEERTETDADTDPEVDETPDTESYTPDGDDFGTGSVPALELSDGPIPVGKVEGLVDPDDPFDWDPADSPDLDRSDIYASVANPDPTEDGTDESVDGSNPLDGLPDPVDLLQERITEAGTPARLADADGPAKHSPEQGPTEMFELLG